MGVLQGKWEGTIVQRVICGQKANKKEARVTGEEDVRDGNCEEMEQ